MRTRSTSCWAAGLHRGIVRLAAVLLAALFLLGPPVGAGIALADEGEDHNTVQAGVYRVTSQSNPRFPVSQKEAELVMKVSVEGKPAEGLKIMLSWSKAQAVDHHGNAAAGTDEATGGMEGMAGMSTPESPVSEILGRTMAIERTPGVYVASPVFDGHGKYEVTVDLNGETAHFVVAVRSGPVSWPLVIGLTGFPLLLAGVVAMIKTIRKEW